MKVLIKKKGHSTVTLNNLWTKNVHMLVKIDTGIGIYPVHEILKVNGKKYKVHFVAQFLPIKKKYEQRIFEHI